MLRRALPLLVAPLFLSLSANAGVVERVVAVVGEDAVLLSDLRTRGRPFLAQIAASVPPGPQRAAAESQFNKELLEKLVEEKLLAVAAQEGHVTVTSQDIDGALENIARAADLKVSQLVQEAEARSGMSEADYREEIRKQLLEGKVLQGRIQGRIRIMDDDLRRTYEQTVREERVLLEYQPAWIVLHVPTEAAGQAATRKLATELYERAKAGEDFAALARAHSDDLPTRDAGGDLGIRAPKGSQQAQTGKRQVLSGPLEAAVLSLESGGVTAPIELEGSLFIVKLQSRQPSRYTGFTAARTEMTNRLQSKLLTDERQRLLTNLKKRIHVEQRL